MGETHNVEISTAPAGRFVTTSALSLQVEAFIILHLLRDPIGTIKDLSVMISGCQQYTDF